MLLAFLAFVVLLSGFVAYAADTIARRAGRRHLRLFGLRPKTTALIVAVASGMGISLASVLAFALLNQQAIRNINQAELLRREVVQLRGDLQELQSSVSDSRRELAQVSTQRDQALTQARTLNAQREQAVADREQALKDVRAASERLKQTQTQRDRLKLQTANLEGRIAELGRRRDDLAAKAAQGEQDLNRTQIRLGDLQAQLGSLQGQLDTLEASRARLQARAEDADRAALLSAQRAQAAQAEARALQAKVGRLQGQLAPLQAQLAPLQAKLAPLQANLAALSTQVGNLQGQRDALTKQRDSLSKQRDALTQQRDALQAQRDSAQKDLASLKAQSDTLVRDNKTLNSELSATRNLGLAYQRGDLVSSSVVASVYSLPNALNEAEKQALRQGARGNPAAVLPPDALRALQATLRGLNTTTLVVCRAGTNTAAGYPVELNCNATPNALLYRRNQAIRSSQISLQGSPDQLREKLLDLVSDVIVDLNRRGVPAENINENGLSDAEMIDAFNQLRARQSGATAGASATVTIASRADVRPGTRIDLYPVVK